ncbi:MAG: hypothetical protein IIW73_04255 [Clostridia bacterium]|nr:hypothetical protein [Clostridia bacterium]
MNIHTQMIRLVGILLVSLCPIVVSLYIYISANKRIKSLNKARVNLEKILSLLSIKSGEFNDFDYSFLNEIESLQLSTFFDGLTTSNSSLIIDECNRLIKDFLEKEKNERNDFLQKGKIIVSTGATIGITVFILLI